jgi:hypothetical protein
MIVLAILVALLAAAPATDAISGNGPPGHSASTSVVDDMNGSGPPG